MFVGCDISGEVDKDRYCMLGSIWIPKKQLPEYEEAVCHFRLENKLWGEIKWGEVTPQKINEYKEFLTLSLQEFPIETGVMVLDKEIVTPEYFEYDKGKMISTYYYRLITHRMKQLSQTKEEITSFDVILDKEKWIREQSLNLKGFLELFLIRGGFSEKINHLSQCDSKICSLLQLCDLITGAIFAKWNQPEEDISDDRKEFISHIESIFNHPLDIPTSSTATKFNLWLMRPYRAIR